MSICPKCGRQLADGEVCQCTAQNASPYMNNAAMPQGTPVQGVQPFPNPQQMQNPNGDPYRALYQQGAQPQKKKSGFAVGCLIAGIIGFVLLIVCAVLAAILVPATIGYVKKSKTASANSHAHSYFNAISTAIVELDTQGIECGGTYIITSMDYKDVNVPFDKDIYEDILDKYAPTTSDGEELSYFAVVEDYTCTYVAVWEIGEEEIGTYPRTSEVGEVNSYSGMTFDLDREFDVPMYEKLYDDAYQELDSSGAFEPAEDEEMPDEDEEAPGVDEDAANYEDWLTGDLEWS